MKITIIAFAALGACTATASAQSNVTIYGIIDAGVTSISNPAPTGNLVSLQTGQLLVSRWGFKGVEDLGNGMKARLGLESTLTNDTGAAGSTFGTPSQANLFDREATVGLSSTFGSVDLGRQNNLLVGSITLADPMGLAFAATNPNVLFASMNSSGTYGQFGANGGGTAFRQNNSVKYASPLFRGLGFSLMHAFGEQPGDASKNTYSGVSSVYTSGPFGVTGAYSRLTNATNTQKLTAFSTGIKYDFGAVVLKSTYSENKVDATKRKISVLGLGVDYPLLPAVTLTGAYYNSRHSGDASDKSQQFVAIAKYALSKRTRLYTSLGRATTERAVSATAGTINLAQGFVSVGSDSANRATVGVNHLF